MPPTTLPATNDEILPLRTLQRAELNCQIVHDAIHSRPGWTRSYLLHLGGSPAGFGSVAISGPWTGKPTLIEFYVLPIYRQRAFDLFESLLETARPQAFEVQTSDALATTLILTFAQNPSTEAIVFQDRLTTSFPAAGAALRRLTPEYEIHAAIERRQGGGEWILEVGREEVGKGGILFHYNRPYGDVYMEINQSCRRRGYGAYLVQELKRACYSFGAIPAARCGPQNVASRKTLQRAGFVPYAHILNGSFPSAAAISNEE